MRKRIAFTAFELQMIIDALNAALAAGVTDWQETYTNGMDEAETDAWLARSSVAMESAVEKALTLLCRRENR